LLLLIHSFASAQANPHYPTASASIVAPGSYACPATESVGPTHTSSTSATCASGGAQSDPFSASAHGEIQFVTAETGHLAASASFSGDQPNVETFVLRGGAQLSQYF